ncbi:MAG: hypothetical protein ACXWRE_14960 [Pseudobdellovibrionaceae bacterium]
MKTLISVLLMMTSLSAFAQTPYSCTLTDTNGVESEYTLTKDIPPDFDGAWPSSMFMEKDGNINSPYCSGPSGRADKSKLLVLSGIVFNSRSSCKLDLNADGSGTYEETIPPLTMTGKPVTITYKVQCKLSH